MINIIEDKNGTVIMVKSAKKIGFNEMNNGLMFLENNESLPKRLRIVEDGTGSEASLSIKEIDMLIAKMESLAPKFESIQHAVIHDNPVNTAYGYIVKKRHNTKNYSLRIFATMDGALKWIDYEPLD